MSCPFTAPSQPLTPTVPLACLPACLSACLPACLQYRRLLLKDSAALLQVEKELDRSVKVGSSAGRGWTGGLAGWLGGWVGGWRE
jgi:hypothetical protein